MGEFRQFLAMANALWQNFTQRGGAIRGLKAENYSCAHGRLFNRHSSFGNLSANSFAAGSSTV